ncbi:hypothetical protein C900_02064 [Fulvivirga imtechensis AK7]|uniref:Uncharacterized protein n=1 Tax=Fulvivirga imtechensis AK7 TaxID=1237149 RepID=L8JY08_9BACT|nr:hypothetical protein C900_02064 [Fulvivirga imtechensis AK7]
MKCQKAERTEVREHFWGERNAGIGVFLEALNKIFFPFIRL